MFTALAVRPALPEANRLHCLIFARFCISNVLNPIYREFCGEQNLVRAGNPSHLLKALLCRPPFVRLYDCTFPHFFDFFPRSRFYCFYLFARACLR